MAPNLKEPSPEESWVGARVRVRARVRARVGVRLMVRVRVRARARARVTARVRQPRAVLLWRQAQLKNPQLQQVVPG